MGGMGVSTTTLKGEPQTQASALGGWVSRCGGSEGEPALK